MREEEEKVNNDEEHVPTPPIPPTIIVTTSKSDALRDDGVDLVNELKKGGGENIFHFEGKGSHVLSLSFDREVLHKFRKTWHDVIWD